ncbi:MAG: HNH endonuclease [Salinivirgaceae bacterium]|nr:HNH endonuclease [Salinivirgaceae bacterium]
MQNIINGEQWKTVSIPNMDPTEDHQISSFGHLKTRRKSGEYFIINPSKIKGYPILNIKLESTRRTTRYIHKLIAEAFINKTSEDQTYVIHIDYNKENNQLSNLKWVDRTELFQHQAKNPNYKKGIIRYSKLTETDVIRLKKKLKRAKNPLYKIAREFGITHTQLNRIRSGENWGHVVVE